MSLFHTHTWEVTGSSYTPPSESLKVDHVEGHEAVSEVLRQMDVARTGETHIYLKCVTCGDIDSRTVPGKWPGEIKTGESNS